MNEHDHPAAGRGTPSGRTEQDQPGQTTPGVEQLQALGATTTLSTAARLFGLSRATAYRLARAGQFPVPVLRAGSQYRVPVAPIIAALHPTPRHHHHHHQPSTTGPAAHRRLDHLAGAEGGCPPAQSAARTTADHPEI